jgi:hypothetical protein
MFRLSVTAWLLTAIITPALADTITVSVPALKSNGLPWDRPFGKGQSDLPDITLCWIDPAEGGKETCLDREGSNRRACNDTLSCTIPFVKLPPKRLFFYVIDLDIARHDAIGQGYCERGQTCEFNGVTLTIEKD